jgi:hypothetical protein
MVLLIHEWCKPYKSFRAALEICQLLLNFNYDCFLKVFQEFSEIFETR